MDLFSLLEIDMVIPERLAPPIKIAGNNVHKLFCRKTKITVQVRKANFSGYFELVTDLSPPLDIIYLKDPKTRGKCPEGVASLKAKVDFDITNWSKDIQLLWEQFPDESFVITPDEVNMSWQNKFFLKKKVLNRTL